MADFSYQLSIRNEKGGISAQFSGNGSGSQAAAGVAQVVQMITTANAVPVNLGLLTDARTVGIKNLGTVAGDQEIYLGEDDGAGYVKLMFKLAIGESMLVHLAEAACPIVPLFAGVTVADTPILIFAIER